MTTKNDERNTEPGLGVIVVGLAGVLLAALLPPPGIPRWIITVLLVVLTVGVGGLGVWWLWVLAREAPAVSPIDDPAVYRPSGVKITTEHAPPGKCWERRPLHSYVSSLDWIIPHLRAMGEGLEQPHIELVAEGSYDDPDCQLYVVGLRDITVEEQQARAAAEMHLREAELELLADLRAKYPEAP